MKVSWAPAQLLETVSGLPVLLNLTFIFCFLTWHGSHCKMSTWETAIKFSNPKSPDQLYVSCLCGLDCVFLLSHSSYEEAMRNQSGIILTCTDAVLLPVPVFSWAHRLAARLPRPAAFCLTRAENHFHWLQVFPLELQADTDVFPTNNPSRFYGFCPFHLAETRGSQQHKS